MELNKLREVIRLAEELNESVELNEANDSMSERENLINYIQKIFIPELRNIVTGSKFDPDSDHYKKLVDRKVNMMLKGLQKDLQKEMKRMYDFINKK